jgi:hypothetical protein
MKDASDKKKSLLHNWMFWLISITLIAITLRSIPAWFNAAWGLDFGIYYGLTNSFIETKELINPYTGWGSSYQFFPVLYVITGISHWITGVPVIELMSKIAPIFGGLVVTIFYFVVYALIKDKRVALISSGILAVTVFHVYQTSHAAPLTIGHFFMMLSLYFFIKYEKHPMFSIPLILSTGLLILSHHFTTYFYIIGITFMCFAYVSRRRQLNRQSILILAYVIFTSAAAFSYWFFVATPVYNWFMGEKFLVPSNGIILLYYLFVFLGVFLATKWFIFKQFLDSIFSRLDLHRNQKIALGFFVSLILLIIVSFTGIPGVHIKITPLAILYSLPMIALISLSYAGLSYLKHVHNGFLIKGWLFGILLSFFYSIASTNLLPDRHFEYLIVPLCIPAALTLKEIIAEHPIRKLTRHTSSAIEHSIESMHHKRSIIVIICIILLFITNIMVAYPSIDSLNSIDERVSDPCINVIEWMNGNVSNKSIIASDHRLEMILWAKGFKITSGETNATWTSDNLLNCTDELLQLNISYVLIDDIMRNKVVNIDLGKYYYMTNESYDKFTVWPFEMAYRNATLNKDNEEIHWVEIYKINQSFFKKEV